MSLPAAPRRSFVPRGLTLDESREWRERTQTFRESTAVMPIAQRTVRTTTGWAGLWGLAVAEDTFAVLGVQALVPLDQLEAGSVARERVRGHSNSDRYECLTRVSLPARSMDMEYQSFTG